MPACGPKNLYGEHTKKSHPMPAGHTCGWHDAGLAGRDRAVSRGAPHAAGDGRPGGGGEAGNESPPQTPVDVTVTVTSPGNPQVEPRIENFQNKHHILQETGNRFFCYKYIYINRDPLYLHVSATQYTRARRSAVVATQHSRDAHLASPPPNTGTPSQQPSGANWSSENGWNGRPEPILRSTPDPPSVTVMIPDGSP